jgi:hypothetical protein
MDLANPYSSRCGSEGCSFPLYLFELLAEYDESLYRVPACVESASMSPTELF